MDISSPGCQPPTQRLCQPVPPSPDCQLVLYQVLTGGSGTYCLNVSLADANSLAMVSTQLVMPGRYLDRSRDEEGQWAEAVREQTLKQSLGFYSQVKKQTLGRLPCSWVSCWYWWQWCLHLWYTGENPTIQLTLPYSLFPPLTLPQGEGWCPGKSPNLEVKQVWAEFLLVGSSGSSLTFLNFCKVGKLTLILWAVVRI